MSVRRTASNWQAQTDVVQLLRDFPVSLSPIFEAELHLFAYLSCLISVFEEHPSADWGYGFIVTPEGFPYAHAIYDTIDQLEARGLVCREVTGRVVVVPGEFEAEVMFHNKLAQSRNRRDWTRTATRCALMVPRGLIQQAIGRSPGVRQPIAQTMGRPLLMSGEASRLVQEWDKIAEVLGDKVQDRLAPSVIWLSAYVEAEADDELQS